MKEQHQTLAEDAVGIQISGNGNFAVIYARRARLHLDRKHKRKGPAKTRSDLLRTDLCATTLVGRHRDCEELQAWLMSASPISVRCITGRPGAGKSRLAIELCALAEEHGWIAGFAQRVYLEIFVHGPDVWDWRWKAPLLVVIDDAAALTKDLRKWLEILATHEKTENQPPLRLLLLERHGRADLGWWRDLTLSSDRSVPPVDELVDPQEPVILPGITPEDRRALFTEVVCEVARIEGLGRGPTVPVQGEDPRFDRALADDANDNEPLSLVMAGILAGRLGAAGALQRSSAELAEELVNEEQERLRRLGISWGLKRPEVVNHLTACVTLEGGCDPTSALKLVEQERKAMRFSEDFSDEQLVTLLAENLPADGESGIAAIQPDLIGELLVILELKRNRLFPNVQLAILERAWGRRSANVAATLMRAVHDYVDSDAGLNCLGWLRHLVSLEKDLTVLEAVDQLIPFFDQVFGEFPIEMAHRLSDAAESQLKEDPTSGRLAASALQRSSTRLFSCRKLREAISPAARAVTLYRELSSARSGLDEWNLASALNTYANSLKALNLRKEAYEAAMEAVTRFRALPPEYVTHGNLAAVLGTLSATLMDLERFAEARVVQEEAIALIRSSGDDLDIVSRQNLAIIHMNRAFTFCSLGQPDEALVAANEAVSMHNYINRHNRGRAKGSTTERYAQLLAGLGMTEAALRTVNQALESFRHHPISDAGAIDPLADTINIIIQEAFHRKQYEFAQAVAEERARCYEQLAEQSPDKYSYELAWAFDDLASAYSFTSEQTKSYDLLEKSLDRAERAKVLFHELTKRHPNRYGGDLYKCLHNLTLHLNAFARYCWEVGRQPAALAAARREVAVGSELVVMRPGEYPEDLAGALAYLAEMTCAIGDPAEVEAGLAAINDTISVLQGLAGSYPTTCALVLVRARIYLAWCLVSSGEFDESLSAIVQAVAAYRRALEVRTQEPVPPEWREMQALLTTVLVSMFDVVQPERDLIRRDTLLPELRWLAHAHEEDTSLRAKLAKELYNTLFFSEGDLLRRDALLDELRGLARNHPNDIAPREALGLGIFVMFSAATTGHDIPRRDALLDELRGLARDHPNDVVLRDYLAKSLHNALIYARGEDDLPRRDAILDEMRELARTYDDGTTLHRLADALFDTLFYARAEGNLQLRDACLIELRGLAQNRPDDAKLREVLVGGLVNTLNATETADDLPRREAALDELRALASAYPDDPTPREWLTVGLRHTFTAANAEGDLQRRDALLIELRELTRHHPNDTALRAALAESLAATLDAPRIEDDLPHREAALDELRALARAYPDDPAPRKWLAAGLYNAVIYPNPYAEGLFYPKERSDLPQRDALLDELRLLVHDHTEETAAREMLGRSLIDTLNAAAAADDLPRRDAVLEELRVLARTNPDDALLREQLSGGLLNTLIFAGDLARRDALLIELRAFVLTHQDDASLRKILALGLANVLLYGEAEGDLVRKDALLNELRVLAHDQMTDAALRELFVRGLTGMLDAAKAANDRSCENALRAELHALAAEYQDDSALREWRGAGVEPGSDAEITAQTEKEAP